MGYLYDDAGEAAALPADARFVIMGDLNADPHDGSGIDGAIEQLLTAPSVSPRRGAHKRRRRHSGATASRRQSHP